MAPASFRPSQKVLHWLIVILVITLYGMTYLEDLFSRGSAARATLWWVHISLGVGLLGTMALRIAARLAFSAPALPAAMKGAERFAAKAAHAALYALLIAAPALGVVTAWYRGLDVTFFGLLTIPAPVGTDRAFSRTLQEAHNFAATALLVLAALHALAALWHHYVRRDDVLNRMLPHRA